MSDGPFQLYGGKFLVTATGYAVADECCCETAAPCECPESGLSDYYRLADYTDGDLTGCETCTDVTGVPGFAPWDGGFERWYPLGVGACVWSSVITFSGTMPSISGKAGMYIYNPLPNAAQYIELVTSGDPDCYWRLTIGCTDGSGNIVIMWRGTKSTGDTPAGTYTRDEGCDSISSLQIEAYTP